ncbi:type III-D CRISPR-associated protein Csx19 [Bacteroides heparinolyticus]|uniref:type III-D CRISPR-associated protein Csx19 n=1 Tax=Prevotella heparinolytica TaxID=28113 RepID=UPI0035A0E94D
MKAKLREFVKYKSSCRKCSFAGLEAMRSPENMDCINSYPYQLLYYTDGVEVRAGNIEMADIRENLLELRAFGEAGEYYLMRHADTWVGRIRTDREMSSPEKDAEDVEIFDELHKVWGTVQHTETTGGKGSCLTEDRGVEVHLPFVVGKEQLVFTRIRSYFTARGELQFLDWRMLDFELKEVSGCRDFSVRRG